MKHVKIERRVSLHYLVASILFAFYGVQVCPLLETITPVHLVLPILVVLLIRLFSISFIEKLPMERQPKTLFLIDMTLFIIAGVALNVFNFLVYSAPIESMLKVMAGVSMFGIFVGIDLALARAHDIATSLVKNGESLNLLDYYASFGKRLGSAAIAVVISLSLVFFLVINKDLNWLLNQADVISLEEARTSILKEVVFVLVVMFVYCFRVIFSYVKNLNFYLYQQNQTLNKVMGGDLSARVPVTSQDEFGRMADGTNAMILSLEQSRDELQLTRDVSVLALASLAETRDNETGGHILRTQHYVKVLAEHLSSHPDFRDELSDEAIDLLYKSAPLHDVGKVGIPDSILLKPGKLTDDEFVIMKTHAQLGSDALEVAESRLGSNSFLKYAREIAACHHEKWDGSGYPKQLKGDDIPISARLMALADVYDALISKRVYKPAFSHEKAKGIILEGEGSHFDPRVVEAFISCENDFVDIADEYKDD